MYRGAAYADSLQYHHCIGESYARSFDSFADYFKSLSSNKKYLAKEFWKNIDPALPRLVEVCSGTKDCEGHNTLL